MDKLGWAEALWSAVNSLGGHDQDLARLATDPALASAVAEVILKPALVWRTNGSVVDVRHDQILVQLLATPIETMLATLGVRVVNRLKRAGVVAIGDLSQWDWSRLVRCLQSSKPSQLSERVRAFLERQGLELGIRVSAAAKQVIEVEYQRQVRLRAEEARLTEELSGQGRRLNRIRQALMVRTGISGPVTELGLSVRSLNCLGHAKIKTVEQLCQQTEADLILLKNFGQKSVDEIKQALAEFGLSLKSI